MKEQRRTRKGLYHLLSFAAVAAAGIAVMATPAPRYGRNYPTWTIAEATSTYTTDRITSEVWFSRSGKEGVGLSVRVRNTTHAPIEATFDGVLEVGGARLDARDTVTIPPGGTRDLYLVYPFDNERLFNQGVRVGELDLGATLNGAPQKRRRFRLTHTFDSFHNNKLVRPDGTELEQRP